MLWPWRAVHFQWPLRVLVHFLKRSFAHVCILWVFESLIAHIATDMLSSFCVAVLRWHGRQRCGCCTIHAIGIYFTGFRLWYIISTPFQSPHLLRVVAGEASRRFRAARVHPGPAGDQGQARAVSRISSCPRPTSSQSALSGAKQLNRFGSWTSKCGVECFATVSRSVQSWYGLFDRSGCSNRALVLLQECRYNYYSGPCRALRAGHV